MSPKNKIKLNLLRKELDKIDDILLKIIQKRTKIVKKVLTLKSYKKEIIDKKRISSILNKIKKESVKRNIDPKITQRIWKNMIWSYINYEKKNFRKK
jgi:chorismate mutase